jgi:hypothetical protein
LYTTGAVPPGTDAEKLKASLRHAAAGRLSTAGPKLLGVTVAVAVDMQPLPLVTVSVTAIGGPGANVKVGLGDVDDWASLVVHKKL